jgi:ABC-type dipeptide/oligopeptide/nickel transport system ATPase component
MAETPPLLQIEGLRTHFATPRGVVRAVDGVNLRVARGEILGIVGESGSGKSVLAQSILRVIPPQQLQQADGQVRFDGQDLMKLDEPAMRRLRGATLADETTGDVIVYDNNTDVFTVDGGAPKDAQGGRGR